MSKIRTYFDDVPEDVKAEISKAWGERKRETYPAAKKHNFKIREGTSFNRVLEFELFPRCYHMSSKIVSVPDISPEECDVGQVCEGLIDDMVYSERVRNCIPMLASNVCDWDSDYAKKVKANVRLRDAVIKGCLKNKLVLTGGETANLADQVRYTGMSWMLTLLSRYNKQPSDIPVSFENSMDGRLQETFRNIAEPRKYRIVFGDGVALLEILEKGFYIMTNDGTGTKSIVCEAIGDRTDISDTLAMCGDDPVRDGAFPIIANIGVHAQDGSGKEQIIDYMNSAGKKHLIPMPGSVFEESHDINAYIMNGTIFSEVKEEATHIGKDIVPELYTVLLYEEQRSNGITTQRKVLEETFGDRWYEMKASEAFEILNRTLRGRYSTPYIKVDSRTLGQLVAKPSTPYFRIDSMMPKELIRKIAFAINVSSGGLIGKTRRLLEPLNLGANYINVFESPLLISLIQMASRIEESKGIIPDEVALSTWGCGTGKVVGTMFPDEIKDYYENNGLKSRIGGRITANPEITITSKCLDSMLQRPYVITHKYSEKPLG